MPTLIEESLALRARYDEEPTHSDHVAALALQIFDGLQGWHRLDDRRRALLHSAALLHDIGWSQTPDGKGHHKWSARLIRSHAWKNLESGEIPIVALVARYHRKGPPRAGHRPFQALSAPDKKTVMILGGILRLADALDRTHAQRVARLHASWTSDAILIQVEPAGLWDAERAMFDVKAEMLRSASGQMVKCVPHGED